MDVSACKGPFAYPALRLRVSSLPGSSYSFDCYLSSECGEPKTYFVTPHSCVILSEGRLRCWGANWYGQLGYGHRNNIGDDETPASAGDVNVGAKVSQIAVGARHSCALLDSGRVRCWGANWYGQLGYGNAFYIGEHSYSAGDVNVGAAVTHIAAGGGHTCVLLDSGRVSCWGANGTGQLGYGHTNSIGDDESPVDAGNVNVGGTVTQIAAGGGHTCALLDSGRVRCWGGNWYGQLGYGHRNNIGDDETLADVGDVDLGLDDTVKVTQIAAGNGHTCALLDSGRVRCWGGNYWYGQLGYGHRNNIGDDETLADVGDVDLGLDDTVKVIQIAAGGFHTCALLDSGRVRCWGANGYGQLGYGHTNSIGDDESPCRRRECECGWDCYSDCSDVASYLCSFKY